MTVREMPRGYSEPRELVEQWRALPEEEQPHLVVYFSLLDYHILAICDTEQEAEEVLACWTAVSVLASLAAPAPALGLRMRGLTKKASPHDFQIRTQASLDHLTDAIQRSYR